jgi:hypothetical protein
MIGALLNVVAVAALGQVYCVGSADVSDRPIATIAPYPPGMADDVRRPGYNGRLWVGRPVIGGRQGAYPLGWPGPGPEAYGAMDNQGAVVYAKTGHQIVQLSPWVRVEPEGLKQLRRAQDFWLKEQGYTGGVRTFVNDLYMPAATEQVASADAPAEPLAAAPESKKGAEGLPEPIVKFEVPADIPRRRNRIRVEGVRFSWPLASPAAAVARTSEDPGVTTVVAQARP